MAQEIIRHDQSYRRSTSTEVHKVSLRKGRDENTCLDCIRTRPLYYVCHCHNCGFQTQVSREWQGSEGTLTEFSYWEVAGHPQPVAPPLCGLLLDKRRKWRHLHLACSLIPGPKVTTLPCKYHFRRHPKIVETIFRVVLP